MADTFGRLFIRPDFHVDSLLLGTLSGILLTLFFGEAAGRVVNLSFGNGKAKEPEEDEK